MALPGAAGILMAVMVLIVTMKESAAVDHDITNRETREQSVPGADTINDGERDNGSLPEEFDAREKWPRCPYIGEIYDQGRCNAGWAMSAVNVLSDRFCIDTKALVRVQLSAQDLLSCCLTCTQGPIDDVCGGGGDAMIAWYHFKHEGVVSGGPYNSDEGCAPYQFWGCPYVPFCGLYPSPHCHHSCQNGYDYAKDKYYAEKSYFVLGERSMMEELIHHGPFQAEIMLFTDLYQYKSGVYIHDSYALSIGKHTVKIVGYGREVGGSGEKYWIAGNSWGKTWGERGFFKLARGRNECDVESGGVAGQPKINFS